jgi:hypothetical protein
MARGAARSGAKNGTKASLTNCRTKLWKRLNFPIDFEVLLSQKEDASACLEECLCRNPIEVETDGNLDA